MVKLMSSSLPGPPVVCAPPLPEGPTDVFSAHTSVRRDTTPLHALLAYAV